MSKNIELEIPKGEYKSIFTGKLHRAIRNSGGLILTFSQPSKYNGQDERYDSELKEVKDYQTLVLDSLNTYSKCETLPSELLKQNEALVDALKYTFSKIGKPIARTKVNSDHYDKYFEIEQLLNTLNK